MASSECECGCGQETAGAFVPGHDTEALRMLLHLQGVLDRDEPISDFLHRRGYGRDGRNLRREYEDRSIDAPPSASGALLEPGRLTDIANRLQADVLKRPVEVGPEHRNQLRYVKAPPYKPGVYVFSENGRALYVGRTGRLQRRLAAHRSSVPHLARLACRMARVDTGIAASNMSGTNSRYLLDTDDGFRRAFDEAIDRLRVSEATYITVDEDDDAGALQALIQLHAAVELDTLEIDGGGYNSFRNIWGGQSGA